MLVESKVTYLSVGYAIELDNSVEKVNRITFKYMLVYWSIFVFVCMFLCLSALEKDVSLWKKQKETLPMNLRTFQGERTGILLFRRIFVSVHVCMYVCMYVCICDCMPILKPELQLLLEKGEASTELIRADRPQGDRWIM